MKRWMAVLTAVLMLLQMAGPVSAFAADPTMTVTVYDDEGGIIFQGSYTGKEFNNDQIDTYFTGLTAEQKEAIGKSTNIKVESSPAEGEPGPEVHASDNAEGQGVELEIGTKTETVYAEGQTEVTVTGDGVDSQIVGIVAQESSVVTVETDVDAQFFGILAQDDATVTVGESVNAQDIGVIAEDHSTVTVGDGIDAQLHGVAAIDNSTVQVTGDIQAGHVDSAGEAVGDGILAEDQAKVTVTGDVSGYDAGIRARDEAKVTVTGDVSTQGDSSSAVVTVGSPVVKVEGNISADDAWGIFTSDCYTDPSTGTEVYVDNHSQITVTGDVTADMDAVTVLNHADVKIGGDVSSSSADGIFAVASHIDGPNTGNESTVVVSGNVSAYGDGIVAADQAHVEVGGNVTAGHIDSDGEPAGFGIAAYGQAEVTVEENVSSEAFGIRANDSAKVTVGGNVEAQESGVIVQGSSEVTVAGNLTASEGLGIYTEVEDEDGNLAENHASVTVDGNVTTSGMWDAVWTASQAEVTVHGNVTAEGENASAIAALTSGFETEDIGNQSTIVADGNATAKQAAAIIMTDDAKITVWGNVTGGSQSEEEEEPAPDPSTLSDEQKAFQEARDKAYENVETAERQDGAVEIYLDEDGSKGQLIIGGTVTAAEGDVPIVINYTVKDESSLTEMPELPEMKIYEIAPKDGEFFDVNVSLEKELNYSWTDGGGSTKSVQETTDERVQLSEEDHAKMVEAIAAAIQYIIRLDASLDNATVEMPGHYDAANGIFTSHENEAVSVTVTPDAGYEFDGQIQATGNYTLTPNEDGSWTLTVLRGGGVTLSAVITRRPEEPRQPEEADQSPSGMDHPAVGRIVRFGRYDFDGDGEAEELTWKILRVAGGYARLAMFTGIDAIPEDFDSAFNEHEKAQIREGSLMALDHGMAREIFRDGLIHPSMYVRMEALDLD